MLNKIMLPANTTGMDNINTNETIKKPIPLVIKRPPRMLETVPTSLADNDTEEPKEISADKFPKLGGF